MRLLESYGDKSIAVLPFVNMSADKDQEYFSDGIAEELLNLLAKVSALRVISRTSAFSFKGTDLKLTEAAEELNVANILEGSVRRAGDRIRVTVQLIEARSDTHLWSETYDRTFDDIFAIQDEIAAKVVEATQDHASRRRTHYRGDRSAGLFAVSSRPQPGPPRNQSMEQSNALFEQALAIDPDVRGRHRRADEEFNRRGQQRPACLPRGDLRSLEKMTKRARTLDPNSGHCPFSAGWTAMYLRQRSAGGGASFRTRADGRSDQPRDHHRCRQTARRPGPAG